jgi:uncharacterized membrane protein
MQTLRLFLHTLAASVWVGGQITLAGLVPTLRDLGDDAPRKVARAFNRLAWPAFGVVFFTGIWNLVDVLTADSTPSGFHPWFEIKFLLFAVSGGGAALHMAGRSKAATAIGGAASSLGAIGAMFLGFVIS